MVKDPDFSPENGLGCRFFDSFCHFSAGLDVEQWRRVLVGAGLLNRRPRSRPRTDRRWLGPELQENYKLGQHRLALRCNFYPNKIIETMVAGIAVQFMKATVVVLIIASVVTFTLFARSGDKPTSSTRTPVLVELFTSEGCSDCPPADTFLQKLDQQPVSTKELIVLSEHVDYWNHDGWTDPYSSHAFSERQDEYMQHFHLASVYTPQMVVDGATQFVGNNVKEAEKALTAPAYGMLASVQIGAVSLEGNTVRAHIDVAALPEHSRKSDIIFVVALNHAESQVASGENSGRHLAHVAVVRRLEKVGTIDSKAPFSRDVSLKLEKLTDKADLRVIAFVQEPGPGRVLGAAMQRLE